MKLASQSQSVALDPGEASQESRHRKLSAERWNRISRLFADACAQPREAWRPYLEREAGGDRILISQVLALLEEDREPSAVHGVIANGARDLAATPDGSPAAASIGMGIGPYRILEQVGHGGMGTVFRARRELCGTHLTVALKLIRPGMDTELVVRRFERERRVLAGLQHPNIARLLDAGASDDGRPFLVMEYVDGEPIDVHCRRRELLVPDRVRLFLDVCAAVEHAHRGLVVHRDLKPSNVLVSTDGVPRLLDFGLAKILESAPSEEPVTVAGQRWMTPEYASPEQADSGPVTTATDVYGLGALLYSLLTDGPPFRFPSQNPLEVARILRDVDPPPPSTVRAPAPSEIVESAGRGGSKLRNAHDLDRIVLKALAKDPGSRYASVGDLARDLRRWRAGRPVRARRWTWRYRTGRFMARNRRWLAGLATASVLLGASAAAHLEQAREADELRRRVEAENARSAEVATFLIDFFGSTDPDVHQDNDLSARELFDRGLDRARHELAERPRLQLTIFNTMSRSYRKLGDFEQAKSLAGEALALGRRIDGAESEVAASLEELGRIYLDLGDFARGRVFLRHALGLQETLFGATSPQIDGALEGLIDSNQLSGDVDRVRELARRRHRILQQARGDDHFETAAALADLGALEGFYGDAAKAVEIMDRALPVLQAGGGRQSTRLATFQHQFGQILERLGEHSRAREQLAAALRGYEAARGPDHPWVATAAGTLGLTELSLRQFERAEELLTRSRDIFLSSRGPIDLETATSNHNLGLAAYRRGDLRLAETWFRQAFDAYVASVGQDHPYAAVSAHYLGVIARRQGRLAEAGGIFDQVLEIRREKLGPTNRWLASTLHELGLLRLAQGRRAEGEALLRDAHGRRLRGLPGDHPEVAESLTELGRIEAARGETARAREIWERALSIVRGQEAPDPGREAALSALVAEQGDPVVKLP